MYQYAIFPFAIQQQPLEDLPVEMAAEVLRYLDGVSLLSAANSSQKLMSICHGDPILRQRLQEQLKKEMELRRRYYLDPSSSVTVKRQGAKGGLFQKNVPKQMKSNVQRNTYSMEDLWTTKHSGGGKVKSSRGKTVTRKPVRF